MMREDHFESLCNTVDDDIQKKRHFKDPFQQNYINLLRSPFQNNGVANGERNVPEISSIRQGQLNLLQSKIELIDMLALDIHDRSVQVHLRTELLRRQVEALFSKSKAILTDFNVSISDSKKPEMEESQGEQEKEELVPERLEELRLYEAGILAEDLLQQFHESEHQLHEIDMMALLEKVNKLHVDIRESHAFGLEDTLPSKLISLHKRNDGSNEKLLLDFKKYIKPFTIDDYIERDPELDDKETTGITLGAVMGQQDIEMCCTESARVGSTEHLLHTEGVCNIDEDTVEDANFDLNHIDDVDMINPTDRISDISVNDNIHVSYSNTCDDISTPIRRFNLTEMKESMHQMGKSHRPIPNFNPGDESVRNYIQFLRSNADSMFKNFLYSVSQLKKMCKTSQEPLFCARFGALDDLKAPIFIRNLKLVGNFDMSLSEPCLNFVTFRQKHKVHEMLQTGDTTIPSTDDNNFDFIPEDDSYHTGTKRGHSDTSRVSVNIVSNKKQKNMQRFFQRNIKTIKEMMTGLRELLRDIASTTRVTFLSQLLQRIGIDNIVFSKKKAFVALVFEVSNNNNKKDHTGTQETQELRLIPANASSDIKILFCDS